MTKGQVGGLALIVVATGLMTRELFPRTEREVVRIPEPVTIDLSDSTRADYEEQIERLVQMNNRQDRTISDLASRPPVVTRDTHFIEVPTAVACDTASFEPRWRVKDLTVGEDVGDRTIMRTEHYEADSGSIVITPSTEQHITLGPLRGVFPRADGSGYRVEFDDPPDEPCDFWCQMLRRAEGAAVASGVCLLRG